MDPITFTSPDGRYTSVAATAADVVKRRYDGWTEGVPAQAQAELPSGSATKAEWVEAAEAQGIDTEGKTKAELQAELEASQSQSSETGAPGVGGETGDSTSPTDAERAAASPPN